MSNLPLGITVSLLALALLIRFIKEITEKRLKDSYINTWEEFYDS